jgi:hypothetical protein
MNARGGMRIVTYQVDPRTLERGPRSPVVVVPGGVPATSRPPGALIATVLPPCGCPWCVKEGQR